MEEETVLNPFLANQINLRSLKKNTFQPRIRHIVGGVSASVFCLIVLTLLLAVPISVLVIGTHYRDARYCPIEPRISLFLIVYGSVSLGWIVLNILISVMTILVVDNPSLGSGVLFIIRRVILFPISIFSFIWLIIGSVWTFGVHNRVIHEYDTINHFYLFTYCHPVLYKFTFIYLIVSYVLIAFQCGYQCSSLASSSKQ